ncbi:helix-turn-helix domain-containing protein [Planococcus rifietoensis]|uniref:helix-turn-helix domain-containing protein n=1 Tax=Planococcus rifietoensis TaxID=200991 RepID=UPI00384B4D10
MDFMDFGEGFGEYVKKLRLEKGLSMRELERRSGLSQSYISQLEKGKQKSPKAETVKKLAVGLGADYALLMEEAGFIVTDSLGEAFGFSSGAVSEERNKELLLLNQDLYAWLTTLDGEKYYKSIKLDSKDTSEIRSLIENYLIKKFSTKEDIDRESIRILLDEKFNPRENNKDHEKE